MSSYEQTNSTENQPKRILFATIINRKKVGACLRELKSSYNVSDNKVFILNNKEDKSKLILTFNIEGELKVDFETTNYLKNTFNIHRKKQTNTLYTINALNKALEKDNNTIVWENYENSLLLTRKDEEFPDDPKKKKLVQIHTSLNNVVSLDDVRDEENHNQ